MTPPPEAVLSNDPGAGEEPADGGAFPSPKSLQGGRGEQPSREADPLQETPAAAPSPAPVTVRGIALQGAARVDRAVRVGVRRAAEWVLGPTASLSLDRRLEVRVSTLLGFGMASVVILLLVVMYIGIQTGGWGRTGPRLPDPLTAVGPGEAGADPGTASGSAGAVSDAPSRAGAAGIEASDATAGVATGGGPGTKLPGVSRPLPRWSPPQDPQGAGAQGGPGVGLPAVDPELRNVQVRAPDTQDSQSAAPTDTQGAPVESPPPSPYVYMIQVRAQESQEGAQRIAEYFRELGFEEHQIEGDPGVGGTRDYTVFIGKFYDRAEADRGCEKLRKLARTKPYLNGRAYFQDSYVVTRKRS